MRVAKSTLQKWTTLYTYFLRTNSYFLRGLAGGNFVLLQQLVMHIYVCNLRFLLVVFILMGFYRNLLCF